jgi:hypothetical protein
VAESGRRKRGAREEFYTLHPAVYVLPLDRFGQLAEKAVFSSRGGSKSGRDPRTQSPPRPKERKLENGCYVQEET